ncbi:MAG TPA: hypothetical protein VE915_02820, partial [Actinomycetota bacterium]|nr:hypothetical protein [Actinomycetota bacterium]
MIALATAGPAMSIPPPNDAADSEADAVYKGGHHDQHGETTGHLPGGSNNVDLVGKLKLTNFAGDIS